MPSIFYTLTVLFLTNFLIEQTTCALPEYLQNLELDDITSLWDKFPSVINQIKQAGMLLRNDFYEGQRILFQGHFCINMRQKEKSVDTLCIINPLRVI
jgi:hypothetical protein